MTNPKADTLHFDAWICELDEDVIQADYGYERGEFTVYPELWRPLFLEGLTPMEAFVRALKAFGEERDAEERRRKDNWARIQRADAEVIKAATGDA